MKHLRFWKVQKRLLRKHKRPGNSARSLKGLSIHGIGPFGQAYVVVNLGAFVHTKKHYIASSGIAWDLLIAFAAQQEQNKSVSHVFLKQELSCTSYKFKTFLCFKELKPFVSEIIQWSWKYQQYPQCNSTTPQAFRNDESDAPLQKKNHTIGFKTHT